MNGSHTHVILYDGFCQTDRAASLYPLSVGEYLSLRLSSRGDAVVMVRFSQHIRRRLAMFGSNQKPGAAR